MTARYDVLCPIEKGEGDNKKTFWVKMGSAWPKDNGHISVQLDALPLNGRLMLMFPKEKDAERF